jgi:hypothetical protein
VAVSASFIGQPALLSSLLNRKVSNVIFSESSALGFSLKPLVKIQSAPPVAQFLKPISKQAPMRWVMVLPNIDSIKQCSPCV